MNFRYLKMPKRQNIKITVDIAIFSKDENSANIILVKRKNEPFKGQWVLPGGFLDEGETLVEAAIRELEEETSLKIKSLEQFKAFGDPGRDPRGQTVTVVFLGEVNKDKVSIMAASDAAEVAWHNLNKLPKLGFDHNKILKEAIVLSSNNTDLKKSLKNL